MTIYNLRSSASVNEENLKVCQDDVVVKRDLVSESEINSLMDQISEFDINSATMGVEQEYFSSKYSRRVKGNNNLLKRKIKNRAKTLKAGKDNKSFFFMKKNIMKPHIGGLDDEQEDEDNFVLFNAFFSSCIIYLGIAVRFFQVNLNRTTSTSSFFYRFMMAGIFSYFPTQILNRVFTPFQLDMYRSRYFAEMTILQYVSINEQIVLPLRRSIMNTYLQLVPTVENADIWSCYILAVRKSVDMEQFLEITYLSLRSLGFNLLQPYVKSMFENFTGMQQQSSFFDFNEFISAFSEKLSWFKVCKQSPALKYVMQLLSLLVTYGCCTQNLIDFQFAGVSLFQEGYLSQLRKKKPSFGDLCELVGDMVVYFMEVGHMCFKTRSFRPLLFESNVAYNMSEIHTNIVAAWPAAQDGAWEVTKFSGESEFRTKAAELIDYYKEVYKTLVKVSAHEAVIVQRKWQEIENILVQLARLMLCGELRKAPFGILIHGGSSVGKSFITGVLTTASVIAQGGNPKAELRKVTNPNDEFFSNYTFGTETIILDDMCNTNVNFTQKSPLEKIIEYINNVPSYPVMADLSSKGKIPLCPKVVAVTTNVDGLNASVYSNEPVSILRRFNIWINVQVKEEFASNPGADPSVLAIDPVKVERYKQEMAEIGESDMANKIPDIWNIQMWTVIPGSPTSLNGKATIVKVPVVNSRGKSGIFSIAECLEIIMEMSKKHSVTQAQVVREMKSVPELLSREFAEKYPHETIYEEQAINISRQAILDKLEELQRFVPFRHILNLFDLAPFFDLRNYLSLLIVPFFSAPISIPIVLSSIVYSINSRYSAVRRQVNLYYRHCTKDNINITLSIVGVSMLAIGAFRVVWNLVRQKVMASQANLDPKNISEIKENEKQTNCWSTTPVVPIYNTSDGCTVSDGLANIVGKNLAVIFCDRMFVNVFFVDQNFFLVPYHFLLQVEKSGHNVLRLVSDPISTDGINTNCHTQFVPYCSKSWKNISGTDLCLYYMANCKPRKRVLQYFPTEVPKRSIPGTMIVRNSDANLLKFTARLNYGTQQVKQPSISYEGYNYTLDNGVTFNGMCMGVWISDTKPTSIFSFHLGGFTNTASGCSGAITVGMINGAMEDIKNSCWNVVNVGMEGQMDVHFGSNFINSLDQNVTFDISPDHPTNYLPGSSNILLHGSCGGTHKYRTNVEYREFGLKFLKRFDLPIAHGPPNMNAPPKWYHFSKNLQQFATESIGPSTEVLDWAVKDYVRPILERLRSCGYGGSIVVIPLTNKENVNGVPGVRFLDALKPNTSAGFPLRGKTQDFLIGEIGNRDFENDAVWKEVARLEDCYRRKERTYPIFVAHLKDEPVKKDKDKVRVFFGNGTPFKLIMRKYWLPVVRLLSELPLLSECAIGINPLSAEWEEFTCFVEKFGSTRCIAGDYKGYDQKEFLSVTQASYRVYLEMAKVMGYTDDYLLIMESMIADLTNFTVLYYGALVSMPRGNASGQNLTAYLNSTANSLNSRCAYYEASPVKPPPPFRDNVAMMTYGDDDLGTVSESCNWFNARKKAAVLAYYGIEYTPPNKEGEHIAFYNTREVDFLKRSIKFIPELGVHLGALSKSSIAKSITCGIPTKELTDEELFGQILDGALMEMFAHGKQEYEDFRSKVNLFIQENELERFVLKSHMDFESRCEMWRETYGSYESHLGYQRDGAQHHVRRMRERGSIFHPGEIRLSTGLEVK